MAIELTGSSQVQACESALCVALGHCSARIVHCSGVCAACGGCCGMRRAAGARTRATSGCNIGQKSPRRRVEQADTHGCESGRSAGGWRVASSAQSDAFLRVVASPSVCGSCVGLRQPGVDINRKPFDRSRAIGRSLVSQARSAGPKFKLVFGEVGARTDAPSFRRTHAASLPSLDRGAAPALQHPSSTTTPPYVMRAPVPVSSAPRLRPSSICVSLTACARLGPL
jgi:hypothetical protein